MTVTTLIPTSGGNNPVNGLPIQRTYCVVFERSTLEILATAGTHNDAQEIANSIYVDKKIDAIADEVRFHDDSINPINIIGMKLSQFEQFVTEHPNHPAIADQ